MSMRTLPKSRRDLGNLLLEPGAEARPVWFIAAKDDAHLKALTGVQRNWLEARGWAPKPGAVLLLPDDSGGGGGAPLRLGGGGLGAPPPLLPRAPAPPPPPPDHRP